MGTKFLSLTSTPKVCRNNGSALKEKEFVSKAISDLLGNRCVEVLDYPPAIVNPLSVSVQSSGKKRLILDLRHVNLYIFKQKFKCEDLKVALKVLSKGVWLSSCRNFSRPQKVFGFCLGFWRRVLKYFQFAVLPFGLSSAPYFFY